MEELFTIKEVAGRLKVKRGVIVRWIAAGRLRAFKLGSGRLWRVRERDLKKFLK